MENKSVTAIELARKILNTTSNAEFKSFAEDMTKVLEAKTKNTPVTEYKEKPETFADRLCNAIKERQLTQIKLAKLSGLSVQTISYYCNGERLPNTDILRQLATALNVSADYLLGIETDSVKATQEMLVKQAQNELLDKIIAFCAELKK